MKNTIKKIAAVALAFVLTTGATAMTFAEEQSEVNVGMPNQPSCLQAYAEVLSVSENQIVIKTENAGYEEIALNFNPETIFIDNVTALPVNAKDIKKGDMVYAYFSTAMTHSIPPQSYAYAIVTKVNEESAPAKLFTVAEVTKNEDGSITFINKDGDFLITVLKDTPVIAFKTKNVVTLEDIKVGTELFAWFEFMTLSFPAQATADRIEILPERTDYSKHEGIFINGQKLETPDANIQMMNGHMMLPVRAVAEAIGYTVAWDQPTQSVHLTNGVTDVKFAIGSDMYVKEGDMVYQSPDMPAPVAVNGRTYVPVSLFVNLLGNNLYIQTTEKAVNFNVFNR